MKDVRGGLVRKSRTVSAGFCCNKPALVSAPPRKLPPTARGSSITAALEKCRALADIHVERADTGGLQAARAETRQTFLAHQAVQAEQSTRTLDKLLQAYVAHLLTQGRHSHVDAQQVFKRHVSEAWPALAQASAVELTPDQVLDMLRRLIEAGNERTANRQPLGRLQDLARTLAGAPGDDPSARGAADRRGPGDEPGRAVRAALAGKRLL